MRRIGYAVLFFLAAGAAIKISGLAVWQLWFFALAPDLTFVIGGGRGLQKGQIHPRAVPFYNAAHNLLGPVALALIALGLTGAGPWLAGALAWIAHISADRALGFGQRDRDGFQKSRRRELPRPVFRV